MAPRCRIHRSDGQPAALSKAEDRQLQAESRSSTAIACAHSVEHCVQIFSHPSSQSSADKAMGKALRTVK